MLKPVLNQVFADNGEHSHWNLLDPETGENMWSESPEEDAARGFPVRKEKNAIAMIVSKEKEVKLKDLKPGKLFLKGDTIGMKSEYHSESGAIEAYIVDHGCMFWGGAQTVQDQGNILVKKLKVVKL